MTDQKGWWDLRTSRLGRDALSTFVFGGFSLLLRFLSGVFLARLLGAEGFGVYSYSLAAVMLLSLPVQVGLPQFVLRETARRMAEDRPDAVMAVWRWASRSVTVLVLVVVGIVGPVLVWWQGGFDAISGRTIAWALILVPLLGFANIRSAALQGLKRVVAGQFPELLLRPALFVGLLSILWYTASDAATPDTVMVLNVGAAGCSLGAAWWMLHRALPSSLRYASPATQDSRGFLNSSMVFALLSGSVLVTQQTDLVILSLFEPLDQVGVYRVATQVAALGAFGLQAMNTVVGPRFAALHARGDRDRLQTLVTGSSRVMLVTSALVAVTLLMLGEEFLGFVFGPEFAMAFAPLGVLLAGQVINSAAGSVGHLLTMSGHERMTARILAISAVVNLILNLTFVPFFGAIGAAAATAISTVLWNGLMWRRVKKEMGIESLAWAHGRSHLGLR